VNAQLECEVVVRSMGQREVRSDITLWHEGAPYCFIGLWEDWRFDTSGSLFAVMRRPEHHILAEAHPEGFVTLPAPDMGTGELALLARRFLGAQGFEELMAPPLRRKWKESLLGRIAAKDAVRSYLFEDGYGQIYPLEITIEHDANGKPVVMSNTGRDMRVSVSHTEGMAAAIAAEGIDRGIDIERIAPRSERFADIAFTADELGRLPESNRDEWLTRLWCAKEAAGKARGTGLQGTPRTLPLDEIKGTRMLVDGIWVDTRRLGQYVIAWTVS
jgi:phosphopantetheinyl transferase